MKTILVFPVHPDKLGVDGLLANLQGLGVDVVSSGVYNPTEIIPWPVIIAGRMEVSTKNGDRQILTEFQLPFDSVRDLTTRLPSEVAHIQQGAIFQD